MKYLKITTTYFIDGHGSADEGGVKKQVVAGPEYDIQYSEQEQEENEDKYYADGEWVEEEDMWREGDGYNVQWDCSYLKPLTDYEATKVELTINAYNKL